jgi:hypothetical protein
MNELYDRDHVDRVLRREGMPADRRNEILDEIPFPVDLDTLQGFLARKGITHDAMIDRLGGSP